MACKCYHADRNFLGEVGICWGTKECEPCSCGGDEAKCNFYDYVRERAKKVVTNADRIRSMTDEELATLFGDACACLYDDADVCEKWNGACDKCWLDWLKQEVTE